MSQSLMKTAILLLRLLLHGLLPPASSAASVGVDVADDNVTDDNDVITDDDDVAVVDGDSVSSASCRKS